MGEPVLHEKKKPPVHWLIKALIYFLVIEAVVALISISTAYYAAGAFLFVLPIALLALGIARLGESEDKSRNLPAFILISLSFLTCLPMALFLLIIPYALGG